MKVVRTPRRFVKEIDGAKFIFATSDLREVGMYWAKRPSAIVEFLTEKQQREKDGNPMTEIEIAEKATAITAANPDWLAFRADFILGKIEAIEGVFYDDDTPVPCDVPTLSRDLPQELLNELFSWYEVEMFNGLPRRVSEEKKSS